MKVFLTGATGAIGPATMRALLAHGHEVRAVARGDDKAARVRAAGADSVVADLFDADAMKAATVGCDAIAHLATNVPEVSKMARPSAWDTHNRLRTDATRNLLDAATANDITTVVKESVTFSYPDGGDAWIDETVPPSPDAPALAPTLEGERLVADWASAAPRRGVVLRFGLFYGPTSRSVDESLRMARWRLSTVPGPGPAFQSSLYTEDVGPAVVAALDAPTGVYNVVDDEPLRRRDYLDAFSTAFELPHLRLTPPWLLRLVGGRSAAVLLASQRVSNRRFRTATGWSPSQPSARDGWAAVAAARRAGEGSR